MTKTFEKILSFRPPFFQIKNRLLIGKLESEIMIKRSKFKIHKNSISLTSSLGKFNFPVKRLLTPNARKLRISILSEID
ncbi:hypothetical protein BpHYR1_020830 [Brachionus plicatilis]|uniref:Uncharacterized protein n=1 Tax=Brachionus plicatilis TaxID=10195 RepID=A0A3M7R1C5_BRAPC|nr:hypothetical protein BpHYR1_020830 [Brachionus plicatilis]